MSASAPAGHTCPGPCYDCERTPSPPHCPACREPVEVYTPTGTNLHRAVRHPLESYPAGGPPSCPGSFGPVTTEAEIIRDNQRTDRWRSLKAQEA